jgi:hypothetical protein
MFLVGGEILLHGLPGLHAPEGLLGMGAAIGAGVATGFVVVGLVTLVQRMTRRSA